MTRKEFEEFPKENGIPLTEEELDELAENNDLVRSFFEQCGMLETNEIGFFLYEDAEELGKNHATDERRAEYGTDEEFGLYLIQAPEECGRSAVFTFETTGRILWAC